LALETSGHSAGVAVFDDERLLAAGETNPKTRTAAGLVPLVHEALGRAGMALADVRLISLPVGPGSFTGLRVGVTTAKTLAYALGCDVLGLDTFEVIAAQSPAEVRSLRAVVDAQRQQLFVRSFASRDGNWTTVGGAAIVDDDAFVSSCLPGDAVTGPGLARVAGRLPSGVTVVDEAYRTPRAETVGQLAYGKYLAGERGDLWQLAPQYFRPSAAEEKRAEQR
jgi:tRNA threonylcarbamoyladenosine biosynthesis protein TsaB